MPILGLRNVVVTFARMATIRDARSFLGVDPDARFIDQLKEIAVDGIANNLVIANDSSVARGQRLYYVPMLRANGNQDSDITAGLATARAVAPNAAQAADNNLTTAIVNKFGVAPTAVPTPGGSANARS